MAACYHPVHVHIRVHDSKNVARNMPTTQRRGEAARTWGHEHQVSFPRAVWLDDDAVLREQFQVLGEGGWRLCHQPARDASTALRRRH